MGETKKKGLDDKLDEMKGKMVEQILDKSAAEASDIETPKELITVSPDELKTLGAQMFELALEKFKSEAATSEKTSKKEQDLVAMLAEAINSSKNTGEGGRLIRPVSKAEIDPEDILEKPAIFFCYSFTYSLLGDKKFGQDVHTPYKTPIRFAHVYRYNQKGSTRFDNNTVCLSSAKIHSKKEAEWLRNHSLFNIKFFEKIDDVRRYDVSFAEKMVEMSNMLNNMSQFEVLERAKLENIPPDTDVDKVRRELTYKLANSSMQKANQAKHPTINFFGEDGKEVGESFISEQAY